MTKLAFALAAAIVTPLIVGATVTAVTAIPAAAQDRAPFTGVRVEAHSGDVHGAGLRREIAAVNGVRLGGAVG